MIMIQIQGAEIVHQEVDAPLTDGTMGKRHVLVFHDPVSNVAIQTIMDEDEAKVDADGNLVLIRQKPTDLTIAGPGDMPPPPGQPGPGQRDPMAGSGRPGR